jgi:hypothetical protein
MTLVTHSATQLNTDLPLYPTKPSAPRTAATM